AVIVLVRRCIKGDTIDCERFVDVETRARRYLEGSNDAGGSTDLKRGMKAPAGSDQRRGLSDHLVIRIESAQGQFSGLGAEERKEKADRDANVLFGGSEQTAHRGCKEF